MDRLALFIATCGYLGYARIAPGTVGSVAGLLIFWAVRSTASPAVEIATIAVVVLAGIWGGTVAERHFARTDPAPVIVDEVAGMLVTLALLPVNTRGVIAGFFFFRVLDIAKPWPSRQFERLHGGLGIMADDVMAAVYANLALQAVIRFAPGWIS